MKSQFLKGKVALITGGARRIGAGIVKKLHRAGMNVIIHYYQSSREANALAAFCNEQRENSAITLSAELNSAEIAPYIISKAFEHWQRLDALINNASRYYATKLCNVSNETWEDLLNSNLKLPFFLARAASSLLKQHKGSIINITDIQAERPRLDYNVYCIAKGGLNTLTRVLARELAPDVRVNAIAPGEIIWPEGENSLTIQEQKAVLKKIPLNTIGGSNAIACAVLFLLQENNYMTGQILNIDGGRTLF